MSSDLKAKWEAIQKKTFTNWANSHIVKKHPKAQILDLLEDLKSGVNLIFLLEALADESLGKFVENPKMRIQMVENQNKCLKFIADHGVKLAGTGAEEIVDGNPTMTLGLIWTLILRFAIAGLSEEGLSAKEGLLLWCQRKTEPYDNVDVKDFTMSFQDGLALCALIHRHRPDLIDYASLTSEDKKGNLNLAFNVAFDHLDVPKLLDADDIVDLPRPDERSIMTYVAQLYAVFSNMEKYERAGRRLGKFLELMREIETLIKEYERRTTALNAATTGKANEFNSAGLADTHAEARQDVVSFKQYKRTEHRSFIQEQGDLATLYSNIQSKLRANSRPPYVAPEGLLPADATAHLETLFVAEKERLSKLNANLREIRERLRVAFAELANPFFAQLTELRVGLADDGAGELEELLASLEARQAQLAAMSSQMPAILEAEQALVDAQIEDNEHTECDADDLKFQLTLVNNAFAKKIDFVRAQIIARGSGGLTAEQINEFKETFNHFDANKSGTLSKLEFKSGLAGLGLIEVSFGGESDKKFEGIWSKVAENGESISFEQFLSYMTTVAEDRDGPEQLRDSFKLLANDKAFVTENDLKVGGVGADQIAYLLSVMPTSGDGKYDYEAYIASVFNSR